MKAIVYEGPETVTLHQVERPAVREGYALIRVAYAGVCGSDLSIYYGTHPRAKAPLVLGHELSGTVVEGHPCLASGTPVTVNPLICCGHCEPCKTGNEHVCETLRLLGIDRDGAMGEYLLVPVDRIVPLPEGVDLREGALIEPIAVAVHTVRETGYVPGDSAVIFGAGTIGLCLALTLRAYGATRLTVVEINDRRRGLAAELGFDTLNPAEEDAVAAIRTRTGGSGADVVYDCAGHQSVADLLPDAVKVRGTIVVVAGYKKPPALNLIQGMFKEFRMLFVRVYREKDFRIAGDLLANVKDYARLITHELPPEKAREGFDHMLSPDTNAVKILFKF